MISSSALNAGHRLAGSSHSLQAAGRHAAAAQAQVDRRSNKYSFLKCMPKWYRSFLQLPSPLGLGSLNGFITSTLKSLSLALYVGYGTTENSRHARRATLGADVRHVPGEHPLKTTDTNLNCVFFVLWYGTHIWWPGTDTEGAPSNWGKCDPDPICLSCGHKQAAAQQQQQQSSSVGGGCGGDSDSPHHDRHVSSKQASRHHDTIIEDNEISVASTTAAAGTTQAQPQGAAGQTQYIRYSKGSRQSNFAGEKSKIFQTFRHIFPQCFGETS